MDTNKIAAIIRAKTQELEDRNGDVVDAIITPLPLINALADYFSETPGGGLCAECADYWLPSNFDRAEFVRIATGGAP